MSLLNKQIIRIVSILMFFAPAVSGADIEDVHFVDTVKIGGSQLSLRGTGLFRYMGFIKAYVGALYMLDGTSSGNVLTDTPKRLEIEYFYPIKGEDFGTASIKVMAENVGPAEFKSLRPRLEKLNAYQDVQPGDRYALDYVPGKGTGLALNGKTLGFIEGADFASALYAMWLGEKPMNKSFKRQLLGSS